MNTSGTKESSFFAPTPLLWAKRMLFKKYVDKSIVNEKPVRLSFIDTKKAYFNGIPNGKVFIRLPVEIGLPSNVVARKERYVYGTSDTGMIWEETCRNALENDGFITVAAHPCMFHHPAHDVQVVVHGDDLIALGTDEGRD